MGKAVNVALLLLLSTMSFAEKADWPEPRHDQQLTGYQPVPGDMKDPPTLLAEFDLRRDRPAWTEVKMGTTSLIVALRSLPANCDAATRTGGCSGPATLPASISMCSSRPAISLTTGTFNWRMTAGAVRQPYRAGAADLRR